MNKKNNIPRLRFREFNDEWKEERLDSVSDIVGGGTPSTSISKYWNGDINWFSPVEIGDSKYVSGSRKKITILGLKKSSAKILPKGSLLFTSRAGIGKTAILLDEASTNQGFQSIVPHNNKLETEFLYCLTNKLSQYGNKMGSGSTFVEVSGKTMGKMKLILPSFIEQKKIGSFFAKMDQLIELQTQKLEQLKKLKQGYLQKMFPQDGESIPRLRFSGFSGDWKEEKLSELVDISTGFPFKSSIFDEDGNFTVITNKSIHSDKKFVLNNGDKINLNKGYNKYILEKGDILITMDGNVGISAVVNDQRMVLAQRVARISHNDKLSDYIFAFLTSNNFISGINKISIGSIIKHISLNDIKDFKCFIPYEEETLKIGNFFNKIDRLIVTEADYLERLKQQKKAYLQKMFI